MSDENYQERIEQLRHDRDKYVGSWRSQCNIAEDVMRERDRMTAELAGANKYKQELSTELTAYMVACENLKEELSGERIRAEQAEVELAEARETRNALVDFGQTYKKLTDLLCRIHRDGGQAICKYGVDQAYVNAVQIVLQTFDRADEAESELARYKKALEVEVTVDSYDYGDTSFICEDIKLPSEFRGQHVRVLIMKEEG